MFSNCSNLTQLDVSNFNTSKVTDMDYMFNNTSKLVNIGMIYCNENTVLKIKEAITNGNVNIWIDENIILPNNTNYVTFKHFKECNKTLYLNSPLLEGDTIEEIEGKTYHVKRYEKIVLDGNENLVSFEEKENTCFVNVIYSPLGKQKGNLICDKFPIGEAYDNDIECIDLHTLNGNLHFNIAKSKLNKISVQGILEYLQQNPVTIVYELAEPIYELVSDDSLLLDSYSGGNLSLDTNITLDKISFTSYEEELTYLYPNTLYTVQFYANDDGIGNVMLGGSLLENKEIVRGLNNIHITTPNVLSNNKLNISITSGNIYISNVVVTNTGMEFNYFEGMKSTFEDMYIDDIDNKYYGKYKVECKIVGKNKFDKTDFTLYKLWRENGTIDDESVLNGASKLLPVTPNTKYKCSNNEGWNQVLYFDKNKKYIGNAGSGETNIITPSNCYYIGVNLRITALDIFQIEEGTIATEYTPYKEYNTSIYLNSPLLQGDKIMVKDNKLCHYHKMGIREYQEGDLDNHITDLINTIYLLTEPYYEDITPIQSSFVIPTALEGDMEILTNLPIKSNITYMTNITSAVMLERQLDEIDSGTNSLSDILDGEINE
jgi:surface protein